MDTEKPQSYADKIVDLVVKEITDFETSSINLSNNVTFSQYQTVQDNLTQQNKGFLTKLAQGQEDDRQSYDIVTPMVETGVVNIDLDANSILPYTDNSNYLAQEYFGQSLLKHFIKQTNIGQNINENEYDLLDNGNLVVRRVDNLAEIYRPVLPQNLYVIDQSARTLEDTTVIEKDVMNQTEVRTQTEWANIDRVDKLCNISETEIPYYEIYYRYGELSTCYIGNVMKEVHGIKYKEKEGDDRKYEQSLVVIAKPRTGAKDEQGKQLKGIVVFAEKLKKEEFKITPKLKVVRYKPYESVRLGKFNGRFWGEGYREIGRPYQNRANELGNQIRDVMKVASKLVFWSKDVRIAGKNVLSSIENGQILNASDLQLLNNQFPNLSLFAEEWNRNINECTKALKAFEVASGETLPSSTSATAINTQNIAVGKYHNFKRERYGLFLGTVFKRWVLPILLKDLNTEEAVEIMGDASYMETIVDAYLNGWLIENVVKMSALSGGVVTKQQAEQILAIKKEELLKNPKLYAKMTEDFFKDVELYVGIDPTGESFNKQGKVSNIMQLIEFELNPNLTPEARDSINEVRTMLGLKPMQKPTPQPQTQMPQVSSPGKLPQKEKPQQQNSLQDNSQGV